MAKTKAETHKHVSDPAISYILADKLDEAAGTVQLLYLAAKSMDDKFQRAAMKEGLFQLLLMLKDAGAEARC